MASATEEYLEQHDMMMQRRTWSLFLAGMFLFLPLGAGAEERRPGLAVQNGWYVHNGRAIWGYAQHNGWWRAGQRANITRNAPGRIGPNRTEDLDKLTDNMLRCGYPGFEHCFGLWYDRRRDAHDTSRRSDDKVVPPFLEQPWARSGKGTSWDGLSRYDLTKYNPWYFARLKEFADLCDHKGTILIFNFYMQHALLETDAHYVDFPWRPANCVQDTGRQRGTPRCVRRFGRRSSVCQVGGQKAAYGRGMAACGPGAETPEVSVGPQDEVERLQ